MRRSLVVLMCATSGCFVMQSKYDRALGLLSNNQQERLQTEADRDVALASMQGRLEAKAGELNKTRDQAQLEKEKAAKEKAGLEAEVAASRDELAAVRAQRVLTEKRMEEWKLLTSKLANMISSGKIKVSVREGRMMVNLPSSVLFASGSAELAEAGKSALGEVAKALKEFPNRQFLIAGHTDNVPTGKTVAFKDNWELSTARSLTVTKYLIDQGLPPRAVAAAGYGEFDPIANNSNARGQQANRRIEIVLMPNIAELPQMPPGT